MIQLDLTEQVSDINLNIEVDNVDIEMDVENGIDIEMKVDSNVEYAGNDYELLINKPSIDSVELYKGTTLDMIGIKEITNKSIDKMFD